MAVRGFAPAYSLGATVMRTFTFAFLLSVSASAPELGAAEVDGYRITSEAELRQPTYVEAIEAFWRVHGRTGSFNGARGVTVEFMVFKQPDPSRERAAVVISSGRTETFLKYKELVFDLWNNGYSVYVHDHRGQGMSGREPEIADQQKGHVHAFTDYVGDLRAFVRQEVLAGGHQRYVVIGHSMGGAVASVYLEQETGPSQPFRAAALSSPMHEIRGAFGLSGDILTCTGARLLTALGAGTRYTLGGEGYSEARKNFEENEYTSSRVRYERLLQEYRDARRVQLGSPTHGWYAAACRAAKQARSNADKITVPVRLFRAGADTIVHSRGHDEFCAGLRRTQPSGCGGPDGGPIEIPDAKHELLIEADDKRSPVLLEILKFFDAQR